MSQKTISFTMTDSDYEKFIRAASEQQMDISQFSRHILSVSVPGFSGIMPQHGGARPHSGRKPRDRERAS